MTTRTTRRKPARNLDRHLRPPISVRLPAQLQSAIEAHAEETGCSRNSWITQALYHAATAAMRGDFRAMASQDRPAVGRKQG